MIKSIAGGQGIVVSGGSTGSPYIDMNRHSAGMVRYNGSNMEVYDGGSWLTISSSYPMIELSHDVHELLQWAKRKRDEEFRLKDIVDKNSAVKEAYDNLTKSQEQLEVLLALVKDHTV